MATAVSPELQAILNSSESPVPAGFDAFLVTEGILTPFAFGVLASKEDQVTKRIIEHAKTKGVQFPRLADTVGVVRSWKACRALVDRDTDALAGRQQAQDDDPLPKPTSQDLVQTWRKQHKFTLPVGRLLTDGLQGRLYRAISGSPRSLQLLLMEQLRTKGIADKRSSALLVPLRPGEPVSTQAVVADAVPVSYEVYIRARAFFSTLALVPIHDPEWFDYDDTEFVSDAVLAFVHQHTSTVPVGFFVSAWASTMAYFVESVCTNQKTMKETVRAVSSWHHYWKPDRSTPASEPAAPASGPAAASGSRGPPMAPDLQHEVDRLRNLSRSLQSQKDKATAELNKKEQQEKAGRRSIPRQPQCRKFDQGKGHQGGRGGYKGGDRDRRRR